MYTKFFAQSVATTLIHKVIAVLYKFTIVL